MRLPAGRAVISREYSGANRHGVLLKWKRYHFWFSRVAEDAARCDCYGDPKPAFDNFSKTEGAALEVGSESWLFLFESNVASDRSSMSSIRIGC